MAQYVIQVKSGNRWSLHSYKDSEAAAVKQSRQLLKQKVVDEAKVIKKGDGEEKIIFNENVNSIKRKAGLGQIADCPVYETVDDLFLPESMLALSRMLRDYCDQMTFTPTELMHSHRSLEKFCDDALFASAVERLAGIQAVKAKKNEQECREKIFDLFEQAKEKARGSGFDNLQNDGLNEYIANAGDLNDPAIRYRVNLSLSKSTMMSPSWEGKFVVLFELLGKTDIEALHENTAVFLDEILSEFFAIPNAILEMLGQQPDRYNAIDVLTKLCIARYEARKWDTPGLQRVSELMAKLAMTKSRSRLANRVEQMLRSRSSLTKGDMHEEKHAFKQLLPLFIAKNGSILGGEGMAEALAMCGTRSFNRDRNLENPSEAIEYIMENLKAPILQLRFLLTLSKSPFGKDCADIVCKFLPEFMEGPEHVHDIVHYKLPLKRKLKILTGLQKSALAIKLPNKMNETFANWLDDLIFNYLDEERIIDKMDSPEDTLFQRATALLQFCASGLLIEGRTLNWVRQRVQEHLRQPNFVEKFTEDVQTAKKKELVITQLHAMLKKAGLQE
ncbi:MAG: hypothetical protein ACNI26_13720 [Terasakiella sp.]|uniref:hypothetical protein n=1 Tax=unclassified Terasakiella TaxID=2614952 RepID=UPI003AFF77F4